MNMAKTKFHVNPETGETGECNASVRACIYGNSKGDYHYATKEEAEKAGQDILASKYGTFNKKKKSNKTLKVVSPSVASSEKVSSSSSKAAKFRSQIEDMNHEEVRQFADMSQSNYNAVHKIAEDKINEDNAVLSRLGELSEKNGPLIAENREIIMRDYNMNHKSTSEIVKGLSNSKNFSPSTPLVNYIRDEYVNDCFK